MLGSTGHFKCQEALGTRLGQTRMKALTQQEKNGTDLITLNTSDNLNGSGYCPGNHPSLLSATVAFICVPSVAESNHEYATRKRDLIWIHSSSSSFFFCKNLSYKNVEAEINLNLRT